jgi:hypothetical protein
MFSFPLKSLFDVSTLLVCIVSAAIGGTTAWAADKRWPVEPRSG